MAVTATLAINFGDKDVYLEAEILEEDNSGKTSFVAGDEVFFRVYHSGLYTVKPTIGTTTLNRAAIIQNIKDLNDNLPETITFTFSGTTSTNKLIHGNILSYTWVGQALSPIQKSAFNTVTGGLNPVTKKSDSVGVANIDYNTIYDLWSYQSPTLVNGSSTYTVVIGITAI